MSRTRAMSCALAALALLSASCGRFARSGEPPPPRAIVDYGVDLTFTPSPSDGEGPGRLTIFVLEEGTEVPIEGAVVRYSGASKGSMVSGSDGRASAKVEPGSYLVDLPPCGDTVLVTTAAEATVGVVAGTESGGPLMTTWEPRYRPTASVRASEPAPWERGERIDMAVRLEDGCNFSPAPGQQARGYAWQATEPFAFASEPGTRAGSDGSIRISVRCESAGTGEVTIYQERDPANRVNVIDAISAPSDGGPYCR